MIKKEKPLVLILAGGSGTRFWPYSRKRNPKQLLPIYSNKTLLEETLARAKYITDSENIFIGTNAALKKAIKSSGTFTRDSGFIIEPEGKNTAPIINLAALYLYEKFGDTPLVVLSADHYIATLYEFQKTIKKAIQGAMQGYLVLIGIKPNRAETGYGYIQKGKVSKVKDISLISSFKEKPDLKTAKKYIRSSKYFWNAGIFVWKLKTFLDEMKIHAPEISEPLQKYFPYKKAGDLKKAFRFCASDSIDYALLEKSSCSVVTEATFKWDDIGAWPSLKRILKAGENNNYIKGKKIFASNSKNNLVVSNKQLVCLLGVDDLVVVEEDDVLYIAHSSKLDSMKEMMAEMEKDSSARPFLY